MNDADNPGVKDTDTESDGDRALRSPVRQASGDWLLDAKDLICPEPLIITRLAINNLQKGDRLTVQATDPGAALDLEVMCLRSDHQYLGADEQGDCWLIRIETG